MKYLSRECSGFQLKGFLSDCCAHRRCFNLGELPLGCLEKTSTGLFLFYLICFISVCGSVCPHPNDDENWKRWGSPKKGLRKESHHSSEGDMGTKPQVLESSASLCPLGDRELKGRGQTQMWQPLGPPGLPVGTVSYNGHCTRLPQETLTLREVLKFKAKF